MNTFSQKKFSNIIKFEFGAENFKYYRKDNQTETEFRVSYTTVSNDRTSFTEKNIWLRNVGFIWCLLGLVILGLALFEGQVSIADGLWLLLGVICLAVFKLTQVRFSVFATGKGNILVLKNNLHDQIVAEIFKHRRDQFLLVYGDINTENDPNEEIAKFKWLRDEGIISNQEFEKKLQIIKLANADLDVDKRVN